MSERPTLAETLHWVEHFIRRYVVLSTDAAAAVALWVAHTHTMDAAECTPYLQINSATKRSGKTRLLEALEPLVARPWFTARTSAAALVRKVHAEHPTLLLDESDTAFNGDKEYAENLRGLLNSGYRRSGRWTCCTGQGAAITAKDFSTFSAKAIAGIGVLPGTVADRSITIELRRRTKDEWCARWREREAHADAQPTRDALAAWARGVMAVLKQARPTFPETLGDRQADVWEPLLAIADVAGGAWPARARHAAVKLSGSVEDTDLVVELLTDIQPIVRAATATVIPTKDLIATLVAADERPWATWRHDKPITPRALARLLGPLFIHPCSVGSHRGYRTDAFNDALARYLPSEVSMCNSTNESGPEVAKTKCPEPEPPDTLKTPISSMNPGLRDTLIHQNQDQGAGQDRDVVWAQADPIQSRVGVMSRGRPEGMAGKDLQSGRPTNRSASDFSICKHSGLLASGRGRFVMAAYPVEDLCSGHARNRSEGSSRKAVFKGFQGFSGRFVNGSRWEAVR
jgi:Protein of unknown function (DUF3631)